MCNICYVRKMYNCTAKIIFGIGGINITVSEENSDSVIGLDLYVYQLIKNIIKDSHVQISVRKYEYHNIQKLTWQ